MENLTTDGHFELPKKIIGRENFVLFELKILVEQLKA